MLIQPLGTPILAVSIPRLIEPKILDITAIVANKLQPYSPTSTFAQELALYGSQEPQASNVYSVVLP